MPSACHCLSLSAWPRRRQPEPSSSAGGGHQHGASLSPLSLCARRLPWQPSTQPRRPPAQVLHWAFAMGCTFLSKLYRKKEKKVCFFNFQEACFTEILYTLSHFQLNDPALEPVVYTFVVFFAEALTSRFRPQSLMNLLFFTHWYISLATSALSAQ